jgi:predicted  nucleic acid-binding Zn-ribbon protein
MAEYLDVAGDEIYLGPHKIATFDPSVWSTLREHVEGLICGAGQAEEAKGLKKTIERMKAEIAEAAEDHAVEVQRLEEAAEDHAVEVQQLEEAVEAADRRTEDAEDILREIGEEANCSATGRVLLAMQDKLRVAEQEIESLRKQLVNKPKKRK